MLDQKTYQVLQHISQRRQCESHKEEQQRCNSDQLNIPIKKKKRGGVGCRKWLLSTRDTFLLLQREMYTGNKT